MAVRPQSRSVFQLYSMRHRRIGIASGTMGRLSNVWQQSRLSLATKLRAYNSLVLSVLLYGCETWTILKTDERKLEAFHMSCQRRILRIRWFHRVTNAEVTSQTEQEDLTSHIHRQCAAVFGHVRRLPEEAPARMAMRLAVDTRAGGRPDNTPHWKQRSGRPRHTWVRQVEIDTSISADVAWDIAIDRCSWRVLRPQLVKRH